MRWVVLFLSLFTSSIYASSVGQAGAIFTSSLPGIVPASGGGNTNFLRADQAWAVPLLGCSDFPVLTGMTTTTFGSCATTTVQLNSGGNTPDAQIFLDSNNGNPLIANPFGSTSSIHIVAVDGVLPGIAIDSFGIGSSYYGRQANGTRASPSGSTITHSLVTFNGLGWNGSSYIEGGRMDITPTESWGATNTGARFTWRTTPNGTTGDSGDTHMILDNDGQLYVNDLVSSSSADSGALCYNSANGVFTYNASSTCLTSSRRFKHGVRGLQDTLALLKALKPVSFRYNGSEDFHYGLIAEDVMAADSRLVVLQAGKPYAVRYLDIISLLVKAVQEQQAQLDMLRK